MSDDMKQLIRELVTAINSRDIDRATACYAPDYEGISVTHARPLQGPAAVHQALTGYLQAIPDLHLVGDVLAEDNRAVLIWTASGTHRGTLLRIPATGRGIQVRGMSLYTIEQQQFTHGLHIWDVAGLLRTLGLLPDL